MSKYFAAPPAQAEAQVVAVHSEFFTLDETALAVTVTLTLSLHSSIKHEWQVLLCTRFLRVWLSNHGSLFLSALQAPMILL